MADKRSSFIRKEYAILGGLSKVLKTKQSNAYQLRMWVSNEKKHVRETLKTRDLDAALERAEKRTLEIYANVKAGKKIFGVRLGELVDDYLEYRQEDYLGRGHAFRNSAPAFMSPPIPLMPTMVAACPTMQIHKSAHTATRPSAITHRSLDVRPARISSGRSIAVGKLLSTP